MARSTRPIAVRLYGALLRTLPSQALAYHAADAEDVFFDLHREIRRERGALPALAHWIRSAGLLIICAFNSRRENRSPYSAGNSGGGRGTPNIRHALRGLKAAPGFSITAILILGLGIGATTTIFSVVDTVVLRQMPYPDAGRLILFDNGAHNYPSFHAWQELTSFESVVAARDVQVNYAVDSFPERLPSALVSSDFFRVLGAAPLQGRLFSTSDYTSGASVAVVSHGAWLRLWGGDPAIVGRTVSLSGTPTDIIGILDPAFSPPEIATGSRVDIWQPLVPEPARVNEHGFHALTVIGRLTPSASLDTAQAEVDVVQAGFASTFPDSYVNRAGVTEPVPLVSLREATAQRASTVLLILLGAVTLMLLIACFNVASLILARGTSRARELALRKALGASRGQLVTLVLTESVLLSLLGGALGVFLTYGGIALFMELNPGGLPRIDALAVNVRVLTFALLASMGTGVFFGVFPAWQATRTRVVDALKEGAASVTASRTGGRMRQGLVVAEIAMALVLLVGAGLMVRTSIAMLRVDPGFQVDGLTVMSLSLDAGYDDVRRTQFTRQLRDIVGATPGVEAVSAGWTVPFTHTGRSRCCWRTGLLGDPTITSPDEPLTSLVHPVTDQYFATLGAPVAAGREFSNVDLSSKQPVVIVNPAAAAGLFGTAQPEESLGKTLKMGETTFEVVGVTRDIHHWGLDQNAEPAVYVPYDQFGGDLDFLRVLVRSDLNQTALASLLREAVRTIDPALPVGTITPMRDQVSESVARPRFLATLFGVFAGVALLLACGGVYGSMLYSVGQRRREMGIRIALGASGSSVVALVLRSGLWTAIVGVSIGLLAALSVSRFLTTIIWGVEPTDPVTLIGVAVSLGAATVAACLVPAWRAARTNPLDTLRDS